MRHAQVEGKGAGPLPNALLVRSTDIRTDTRALRAISDLASSGMEVKVLGWKRNRDWGGFDEARFRAENPCEIVLFDREAPHGRGLANLRAMLAWQKWVAATARQIAPSIIYACDLDASIPVRRLAKELRIPWVMDQFDPYEFRVSPALLSRLVGRLERKLTQSATIAVVADESRRMGFPHELVVSNIPQDAPAAWDVPRLSRTLVFGGLLLADRGLETAIEVVSSLPGWRLIVAGFGPLEPLVLRRSEAQPGSISFAGRLDPHEMLHLFRSATAVLATYDPTSGNNRKSAMSKVGECAVTRSRIIVSRGTNAAGLALYYDVGVAVRFGDRQELMNALLGIEEGVLLRQDRVEQGWLRYLETTCSREQHDALKTAIVASLLGGVAQGA